MFSISCYGILKKLFTAVQRQQLFEKTSAIKVTTIKFMNDFHYEWKPSHAYYKIDTSMWGKMNGIQRGHWVSPWKMYCMYSSMAKDTSWAEAMSNNEKFCP